MTQQETQRASEATAEIDKLYRRSRCPHRKSHRRIGLNLLQDFSTLRLDTAGLPERFWCCPTCAAGYMATFNIALSGCTEAQARSDVRTALGVTQ